MGDLNKIFDNLFQADLIDWWLGISDEIPFIWMYVTEPYWWDVNIGSSKGWCCQATSHYPSQCWPRSMLHHQEWVNSSWPSATYMRRDFLCLFPQRPRYVALISVLISPVPHIWGVTNGSLLASPPNSRRSPASLISPAPHICGASRTPILTRVVWKILNVVTKILVVLPDYLLP